MEKLGNKIRKIRELKNIKQDYMAEQLGISAAAYSKLERDEINLSEERLNQISKIFELSIDDIRSFDEKQIFNIMHNQTGIGIHTNNVGTHIHQFPEDTKKLYEDKIKLLEDKINYLSEEIQRLKK